MSARETIVESNPIFIWFSNQALSYNTPGPPPLTSPGYHTTLMIGHLVMDVAGVFVPAHADVDHGEHFVKLFPALPGEDITWPPQKLVKGIGDEGLI